MQNLSQESFELYGHVLPMPRGTLTRVSSASELSQRGSKTKVDTVSTRSFFDTGTNRTKLGTYLYKKFEQQKWFEEDDGVEGREPTRALLGVILRSDDGLYSSEPRNLDNTLVEAVKHLGASYAATVRSGAVRCLLDQATAVHGEILLSRLGPSVRVVNHITQVLKYNVDPRMDSAMFLCKKEKILLICSAQAQKLIRHGADIEDMIFSYLLGVPQMKGNSRSLRASSDSPRDVEFGRSRNSRTISTQLLPYLPQSALQNSSVMEKLNIIQTAVEKEQQGDKAFDPEREGEEAPKRKMLLNHALVVGASIVLVVVVEMACIAKMVQETRLDGNYTRFALTATVPLFATFSLFFMIVICGSLWQIFGPLSALKQNSKFYSAVAPKPGRYPGLVLPHITIQIPVYKEGLTGVIIPTVTSVIAAVKYYEDQGGTASIFVNDDGMQLVGKDHADARKAFYELNNIGWCARPPHKEKKKREGKKSGNEEEDDATYFLRKGQFKKASNMNYCLDFSLRVEDEYLEDITKLCRDRGCTEEDVSPEEEDQIYQQARDRIVENDRGRTWAAGDVRLGAIILIIDSDTRVPEDCLLFGALEMHESPELALLQHASGIMQVVNNAFEDGITYFTNLIYNSIQFAVGSGDCAPFVGHNTFIRWEALQSISWFDEEDKCTKFWSDAHVSEDFDVSLRLQMNDFVVRLATYHDGGFKEGVSLTVYDELARWEKYAYGCNELCFNPLYQWPYKGPFTRLFIRFLFSKIKVTSKVTIFAYICTYYAVASAIPLSLANYLIVGWLDNDIDQFYLTSWKVFVGMAVVFNILSPLGYAMLRHRLGKATFFLSLWDTIKWTPMFLLFFGGISFHLLKAIFCHFFSIKMEWTTTAKEYNGGFRVGLDRIVRDFKWMYLVITVTVGGMIYLARFAPYGWTIKDFSAIVPLANQVGCHALLPFALGLF